MKSKDMLAVVLRIGAIVIVINIFEKLPLHYLEIGLEGYSELYSFVGFVLLPNLLILFVAIIMWFYPERFLHHISDEDKLLVDKFNIDEFASILLAIVGLYIVTFSFADLIYHITSIRLTMSQLGSDYAFSPELIGMLLATIVELLIGFALIYGRNIVVMAIQQFKKEVKKSL